MIAKALTLKCLTNMHVGNGDVNFNIIDNEVERDTVTKYPTIHSSGVKGAIREFMEIKYNIKNNAGENNKASEKDIKLINDIFGKEGKAGKESAPGKIRFLSANMLALPMRASQGDKPYYMVTTQEAIDSYNNLAERDFIREILRYYRFLASGNFLGLGSAFLWDICHKATGVQLPLTYNLTVIGR